MMQAIKPPMNPKGSKSSKWEYQFITSDENEGIDNWLKRINIYGEEGWELVGIIPETERNFMGAYFKRMKD